MPRAATDSESPSPEQGMGEWKREGILVSLEASSQKTDRRCPFVERAIRNIFWVGDMTYRRGHTPFSEEIVVCGTYD
jgi:hypothetical protein